MMTTTMKMKTRRTSISSQLLQGGLLSWTLVFTVALAGSLSGQVQAAADSESSQAALKALHDHLTTAREERPDLGATDFAEVALTKADALEAQSLLWEDYAARLRQAEESQPGEQNVVRWNEYSMRYAYKSFGDKPAGGRSLFISMHGGGAAPAYVNDQQWANQIHLYQPSEGVYLAPRAPSDSWNMWHQNHIDPLFDKLISRMVILHEVNPDRVYLMGYSAGGDGVYQLAPRMADRWAAATAAAGHPNEASPLSLRNLPFSIHVGEHDSAYNRNGVAREWQQKLALLQQQDPGAYLHSVQIHRGLGHWMNRQDAVAIPWMAQFTRNPLPQKIVWQQDDVVEARFYWLGVDPSKAQGGQVIKAHYHGQQVKLEAPAGLAVNIHLSDAMLDLDQPLTVVAADGRQLFRGMVARRIAQLVASLEERGDQRLVFSGQLEIQAQP